MGSMKPPQDMMSTLEARLSLPQLPWAILQVPRDATIAEACEAYVVMKRQLLRATKDGDHRALILTEGLRRALVRFCRHARINHERTS